MRPGFIEFRVPEYRRITLNLFPNLFPKRMFAQRLATVTATQ
jgi:hypothetical protein